MEGVPVSTQPDYTVLSQVHKPQWSQALQQAVQGWEITVRDNVTGTVLPVFVDDEHYSADNARILIEAALEPIRQIAGLGATPARQSR